MKKMILVFFLFWICNSLNAQLCNWYKKFTSLNIENVGIRASVSSNNSISSVLNVFDNNTNQLGSIFINTDEKGQKNWFKQFKSGKDNFF